MGLYYLLGIGIDYMNLSEDNRINSCMCIQKIFCTSGSHQPARKIEAAVPVWKEKAERMTQKVATFSAKTVRSSLILHIMII